ncbi:type III secretion system protein [Paraburkholderia sp. 2C]|jgi:microsomal dipeptidase-like Zn-dependent dipeptidase
MKDRRVTGLEQVLVRRRKAERKLNAALAAQRAAHRAQRAVVDERRGAADVQAAELAQQDGKIDAMFGSSTFRADALLMLREFRAVAAERHAAAQAQVAQEEAALAAKQAEVDKTSTQIVRNRARIDIYGKRRDALVKAIEAAIEDAQDEEASESRRPGARMV